MEITRQNSTGGLELIIKGRLDGYWAEHLSKELAELLREGAHEEPCAHVSDWPERADNRACPGVKKTSGQADVFFVPLFDLLPRPAQMLGAQRVEHAARVDHEVGRVEDSGFAQAVGVFRLRELVS